MHIKHARHGRSSQGGFTLIELMIVVAIIAILAGIALPQYRNYVTKSKFGAALSELSTGKIGVETMLAEDGDVANAAPEDFGIPKASNYCSFESAISTDGVGGLVCKLKDVSDFGSDGKIALNRDSDGAWTCSATVKDPALLPKACGG